MNNLVTGALYIFNQHVLWKQFIFEKRALTNKILGSLIPFFLTVQGNISIVANKQPYAT